MPNGYEEIEEWEDLHICRSCESDGVVIMKETPVGDFAHAFELKCEICLAHKFVQMGEPLIGELKQKIAERPERERISDLLKMYKEADDFVDAINDGRIMPSHF